MQAINTEKSYQKPLLAVFLKVFHALALSDYKTSQINRMNGIGLDNLLSLWFDKYLLNKNGYFELIKNNI